MKRGCMLLLLSACGLISVAKNTDSLNVYFDLNRPELNSLATRTIDSLIYNDALLPGQGIMILGFADYLGSKQYNESLSFSRARNVKAYLIKNGFDAAGITLCIGKGKIERPPVNGAAGFADDRKVVLITGISVGKPVIHTGAPAGIPASSGEKITSHALTSLKKNQTLRLENIYFLPGSHKPTEASLPELNRLYEIMRDNPTLEIQIEGHICCETAEQRLTPARGAGNSDDDEEEPHERFLDGYDIDDNTVHLSSHRAKAIYDYLIDRGISSVRLKYRGFGRTRPLITDEKNPADENKNRRVEIRIIGK